jgi:hypothetical protein
MIKNNVKSFEYVQYYADCIEKNATFINYKITK